MIYNTTRQSNIANKVERADNPVKRMIGLLGRSNLSTGEALIIVPCQSVHMLFMKFAIDVVFLNKHNEVVGLCPHLPPFGFSAIFWKSACAIELPAGTIEKSQTQLGDQVTIQ